MISINAIFNGPSHLIGGTLLQLQVSRMPCVGEHVQCPGSSRQYRVMTVVHYLQSHDPQATVDFVKGVISCHELQPEISGYRMFDGKRL